MTEHWITVHGHPVLIGGAGGSSSYQHRHELWAGNFTPREKEAFYDWGGLSDQGAMRDISAGKPSSSEWLKENVDIVNRKLDEAPKFEGRVHRGLANVPVATLTDWIKTGEVKFPALSSATTRVEGANSFATFKHKRGKAVRFDIESKTGVDIAPVALMKKETEVLFKAGTRFSVTQVTQDMHAGKVIHVLHLKEVA